MTTIKPAIQYATRFQEAIRDAGMFEAGMVQTSTDAYEIDLDDQEAEEQMIDDLLELAATWNIPGSEIEITTK